LYNCEYFFIERGTVVERGCVPKNYEYPECEKCYEDLCNNANAISINLGIWGCVALLWATEYIVRDY